MWECFTETAIIRWKSGHNVINCAQWIKVRKPHQKETGKWLLPGFGGKAPEEELAAGKWLEQEGFLPVFSITCYEGWMTIPERLVGGSVCRRLHYESESVLRRGRPFPRSTVIGSSNGDCLCRGGNVFSVPDH